MTIKNVKICHLTSVHSRYDMRIFHKMCVSLAQSGYDISLIVIDGKGNEKKDNVKIFDAGMKQASRLSRILKSTNMLLNRAIEIDADIYHLHDPELLFLGNKLRKIGKKIIFDAHEDFPKQLLTKPYLNKHILRILAFMATKYEQYVCPSFSGIITATPYIKNKFLKINSNTQDINNYPLEKELHSNISWHNKQNEVAFVGGISRIRGIKEVINACSFFQKNTRLNLVGNFSDSKLHNEMKENRGWSQVNELGFLNRDEVKNVLMRSIAGVVTFLPVPNHIDAQPNKMFEYMSAGIPVIASNFPLWREIIEGNKCGLCIDPLNPQAIAEAVNFLVLNPDKAKEMGENGRKAILEKYNWQNEESKLLTFYEEINFRS